jgi:hypothetical protein
VKRTLSLGSEEATAIRELKINVQARCSLQAQGTKMKIIVMAATAAFALTAAPALSQTIINVDGVENASLDGSNAVEVVLEAGTYSLAFIIDEYTAFSRFSSSSQCMNGEDCRQGWENSVNYVINGVTYGFGDGSANGGYGPLDPGDGYFDTALRSYQESSIYGDSFTLTDATSVSFYIYDDNLSDNRGGVSLALSAVPEPATWAFMIVGFGAVGASMRSARRIKNTSTATA